MKNHRVLFGLVLSVSALVFSPTIVAQDAEDETIEEIITVGIRGSLTQAIDQKRNSDKLVEVIIAEDIGKLPDQNLAEVMEGITGVQITRTAGVGTGVQIRGTNANRVEINGVSTVGSGSGRSGIDFEDVNASIIHAVEVTKAPDAKTIEGSVGGTVNLKTIRPLELTETLGAVRLQFEDSSLSTESAQPRFSGAFGDNWDTDAGSFGFVISGSYTEQESVSFRPRTDRDNRVTPADGSPEYIGIQFFVQEQENFDYETTNLATTLEWAPNDNLKFSFDAIINEQERSQDSYRLQASGVSALINDSIPTDFETVDFGVGPGEFLAALRGTIEPNLAIDDDDPNLRFSSDTGSRVTDSEIFALAGEWQINDRLSARAEYATTSSDTVNPNLSTTLNFINPGCPLDGTSNDNCFPVVYDLSGKSLAWGINFNSPFAPSVADLTNPANVVLDQVQFGRNTTNNEEDAFRLDFTYDLDWKGISSVDFGYRYNESSSRFDDVDDRIGGFSRMVDSPNGTLFSELLVPGPNNYGDADGRSLFITDFLLVDPDRAFSDPQGVLDILQAAVIAHDPASPDILNPSSDENAFFDVGEETTALYAQANFEAGIFRGNFGVRYLETDIDSVAFGPEDAGGNRSLQSTKGSYDFLLPRLNIIASPRDDVLIRFGYGTDIRRPNFSELNTGFTFDESENSVVALGNPGLEPEEVDSIDLSVEWYFADAAVVSIGYFTKDRTNIFGIDFEGALLTVDPTTTSGFGRETNPSCPGGGIYNPIVVPNVLGDPTMLGMCVDVTKPGNDPATTTQSGVELAFQYDLTNFEDRLGWASGFGVIANYTKQDFSGGSIEDCTSGRGQQVLGPDICQNRGLLDFSEDAYNLTFYYEKYDLSARMRYTWREGFRTQDFGGGANTSGSSTFSFPVNTLDRSQLNASISYAINDNFDVGIEAVNLTEEPIYQHCVSESGPLCFVGYPDRRVVFGGSYRF
ncbi:MAG: TonB-dependent receptor [Gammaproteobacteria bacterium]|nr:TonB-dependent receptor [Gammaproteobacteria bacterium]NNL52180.1 TonB-dependent receptor [Woeseiaceae bacterium]